MAYSSDKKPLELTPLTTLASDDTFIVGNTSDTDEPVQYITKANLEADLTIDPTLIDIPSGPLVILAFGDSNTDGLDTGGSALLTQNSNVHVYATTGTGTWNPANLQWRNVNPNGPLITDNTTLPAGEPYVGILRNSNGSMSYTMADRLQRKTGREVYLLVVHLGGVTAAYYQPGGGAGKEGMTALELYIPQALALIPGMPTKVDYVMISLGGNDVNTGVSEATFVSNWGTMYDRLVTLGYIEEGYTRTFQIEAPHTFVAYTSAEWRAYELLSNSLSSDISLISSAGYDTIDTVHYTVEAQNSFGKIAADLALLGKTRTRLNVPFLPALDSEVVKLTGDQTITGVKSFTNDTGAPVVITNTSARIGAFPVVAEGLTLSLDPSTAATVFDQICLLMKMDDSAGNQHEYGRFLTYIFDPTDGSEDGGMLWALSEAGTLTNKMFLLGSTLGPLTNDGLALGTTVNQWSDLFLAEGGVINWDNGDATLTQVGNVVTLAGADLKITTAGTAATSVATLQATQTLTNKRVTKRVGSTTSSATPTINTDNVDVYKLTAQAADITSFTTNLSGTPTDGQTLVIQITGTATRAITWGASFEASTVALPTTTVSTALLTVGFMYNSVTSKWRCLASA